MCSTDVLESDGYHEGWTRLRLRCKMMGSPLAVALPSAGVVVAATAGFRRFASESSVAASPS